MERDEKQRGGWIICLVLALATFALYAPVVHHDFINFDDQAYIVENNSIQNGVTPASITWAFTTDYESNWHPLTWISHMLDYQMYGLTNPGGHHLTSLLFHIANTLLLFIVLRRMTGAMWRSAIVAALFAWHPLHVESVAWAAERKDVLSAFFWLLTMLSYARYAEQSKAGSEKSKMAYAVTLLCFALGLMSKPMVVTLPFALLLLDFWPLKRVANVRGQARDIAKGEPASGKTLPQLVWEKVPFFALAGISSVVTFLVQRSGGAVMSTDKVPVGPRLLNAIVAYGAYLEHAFWPSRLAIFYPLQGKLPLSHVVVAALVLAAVSVVAIRLARSRPWLLIGWLWYLGMLVPVIGLVQVGSQAMADRYTYLPLIGIFIAVVWGVAELTGRGRPGFPVAAWGLFSPVLVICFLATRTQLAYWKNTETLFRRDLEVTSDNASAHFNLGRALDDAGHPSEAAAEFTAALKANPAAPLALVGMGRHFALHGDEASAVKYYRAALSADPAYGDAHFNLANLLVRREKFDEAAEHFAAAVRAKPEAPDAHNNYGAVLMRLGKRDEAMAQFIEALRLKPNFPEAQDQLGSILLNAGRADEAQPHFAEAVRLDPKFVHARMKLGLLLAQHGELGQAIEHFQAVLKLEPTNSTADYNLAAAYAAANQPDQAAKYFADVVRLRPEDADARARLGSAFVAQGKLESATNAFSDALELDTNNVQALQGLAWILATAAKAELRDGAKAVRLAEQAVELTKRHQPAALASLDAAYAEVGRFDDAIKTAQEAQQIAAANNRRDFADQAGRRIELYKTGKPFRQ